MTNKLTLEEWQARNRKIAVIIFRCALVLVLVPSLIYMPFAQHRRELLIIIGALSLTAFLGLLITAVVTFRDEGLRRTIEMTWNSRAVFSLAFVPFILTYVTMTAFLDLQAWIANLSGTSVRAAITAALVLFLGITCFMLRLHGRAVYGLVEVVVGVTVALRRLDISKIGQVATDPELALALLTASIYLVVRGFDNIHQGLTKEPRDAVSQLFLRWLLKPVK
jgi:hypothetical protein